MEKDSPLFYGTHRPKPHKANHNQEQEEGIHIVTTFSTPEHTATKKRRKVTLPLLPKSQLPPSCAPLTGCTAKKNVDRRMVCQTIQKETKNKHTHKTRNCKVLPPPNVYKKARKSKNN